MKVEDRNKRMRTFLRFLINEGKINKAAKKTHISTGQLHLWRKKYPMFDIAIRDVRSGKKNEVRLHEVFDHSVSSEQGELKKERMQNLLKALAEDSCTSITMAINMTHEIHATVVSWRSKYPDFDEAITQILVEKKLKEANKIEKLAKQYKEKEQLPIVRSQNKPVLSPKQKGLIEKFLSIYPSTRWNITETCRQIGCSPYTIHRLRKEYPEFETAMGLARTELVDKAESKMAELVESTSERIAHDSAKYVLDNLGTSRGYGKNKDRGNNGGEKTFDKEQLEAVARAAFAIGSAKNITPEEQTRIIECEPQKSQTNKQS
jgi:uncharacterized protein YfbU (UPF0304 family)